VEQAIQEAVPIKPEHNVAAAREAYHAVRVA
jgi:hypothetical protein